MKDLVLQTLTLTAAIFCGASGFVQMGEENYGWGIFLLALCFANAFAFVARMLGFM